jgi:hypothetical protein
MVITETMPFFFTNFAPQPLKFGEVKKNVPPGAMCFLTDASINSGL